MAMGSHLFSLDPELEPSPAKPQAAQDYAHGIQRALSKGLQRPAELLPKISSLLEAAKPESEASKEKANSANSDPKPDGLSMLMAGRKRAAGAATSGGSKKGPAPKKGAGGGVTGREASEAEADDFAPPKSKPGRPPRRKAARGAVAVQQVDEAPQIEEETVDKRDTKEGKAPLAASGGPSKQVKLAWVPDAEKKKPKVAKGKGAKKAKTEDQETDVAVVSEAQAVTEGQSAAGHQDNSQQEQRRVTRPRRAAAVAAAAAAAAAAATGEYVVDLADGDSDGGSDDGPQRRSRRETAGKSHKPNDFFLTAEERKRIEKLRQEELAQQEHLRKLQVGQQAVEDLRHQMARDQEWAAQHNKGREVHPFMLRRFKSAAHSLALGVSATIGSQWTDLPPLPPVHITQAAPQSFLATAKGALATATDLVEVPPLAAWASLGLRLAHSCTATSADDAELLSMAIGGLKSADEQTMGMEVEVTLAQGDSQGLLRELAEAQARRTAKCQTTQEGGDSELMDTSSASEILASLETRLRLYQQRGGPSSAATAQSGTPASDGSLLWASRYAPQKASEVCGNSGSTAALKSWLEDWKTRIQAPPAAETAACEAERPPIHSRNGGRGAKKRVLKSDSDSEDDWFQQGCTPEEAPEGPFLAGDGIQCNALLLSGPCGAGKTAAAYAVAHELGFSVLEVNCSEERSGQSLLKLFGEATQSNRLRVGSQDLRGISSLSRVQDAPHALQAIAGAKRKAVASSSALPKPGPAKAKKQASVWAAMGVKVPPAAAPSGATEAVSGEKEEKEEEEAEVVIVKDGPRQGSGRNQTLQAVAAGGEAQAMTLLLFEEVDLLLEEDRGFLSALAQLITESKRPILMTSNSHTPPPQLQSLLLGRTLAFSPPQRALLEQHLALVCACEGLPASLAELTTVLDKCEGDIRQSMMVTQYVVGCRASAESHRRSAGLGFFGSSLGLSGGCTDSTAALSGALRYLSAQLAQGAEEESSQPWNSLAADAQRENSEVAEAEELSRALRISAAWDTIPLPRKRTKASILAAAAAAEELSMGSENEDDDPIEEPLATEPGPSGAIASASDGLKVALAAVSKAPEATEAAQGTERASEPNAEPQPADQTAAVPQDEPQAPSEGAESACCGSMQPAEATTAPEKAPRVKFRSLEAARSHEACGPSAAAAQAAALLSCADLLALPVDVVVPVSGPKERRHHLGGQLALGHHFGNPRGSSVDELSRLELLRSSRELEMEEWQDLDSGEMRTSHFVVQSVAEDAAGILAGGVALRGNATESLPDPHVHKEEAAASLRIRESVLEAIQDVAPIAAAGSCQWSSAWERATFLGRIARLEAQKAKAKADKGRGRRCRRTPCYLSSSLGLHEAVVSELLTMASFGHTN